MYLYYEHHRDASGQVTLTELVLSSYGDGRLAIAFSQTVERAAFELCKPTLKFAPIEKRSYDSVSNVWTYFDDWGVQTIQRLKAVTGAVLQEIKCIKVQDLAAQAMCHRVDLSGKPKMRPEDFFYNYGQPAATPVVTKETIAMKLKALMGDTLDKSAYRRAALKYHPDRNNGDGSKMSELNSLWSVYNA